MPPASAAVGVIVPPPLPPLPPHADLICTKDVSGRKSISITNTHSLWHASPGRCQSKWESMLTFITICVRRGEEKSGEEGRGGEARGKEGGMVAIFTPFNFN